jgi:4'-phosphopantetheinyl transferase
MPRHIDYLPTHEVHVWILDLDESAYDKQLLSEDEQKRAAQFVRLDDQRRFRTAHASVRQILGRYLNEPPLSLVFGASTTGKPFLKAPGRPPCIAFNLAHSAQYGLLALTRDREVGVDIEIERNLADLAGMAQQIMSPTELQCFESTAAHLAGEVFFGLWTRKEALLKASGTGFSTDPRDLDLGLENRETTLAFRGTIWSVAPLGGLLPLQAAIAVSGQLPAVRIFDSAGAPV